MFKLYNTAINRVQIVNLLYQYQFYNGDGSFLTNSSDEIGENELTIYEKIINYIFEIDDLIETNLFNYSFNRLNMVDMAIVRLATFEMLYTDMPHEISINEAIILTKELSDLDDGKQHKFSNKLLDNIKKAIDLANDK